MPSHHAVLFDGPGLPLQIRQRSTPPLGPNQVLIKVQACGVNPVDWKIRDMGWCVIEWPSTIGCDGAGVVAAVGSDVTREYAVAADTGVSKIPNFISFEEAAGVSMASFTAFVGLFHETGADVPYPPTAQAHLPEEDSYMDYHYEPAPVPNYQWPADLSKYGWAITILGGSSSVGQYMIQFARIVGFRKILTTASASNHAYLRTLGATHLFDRSATASDIAAVAASPANHPSAVGTNQPHGGEYTPLVFDAIGSLQTLTMAVEILSLLTPEPMDRILVSPSVDDVPEIIDNVDYRGIYAIVQALWHLSLPFYLSMEEWLAKGEVVPNRIRLVGTVERTDEALEMSRRGVSGVKLIMNMPW
ncbi:hypothetical protein FRB90_002141 [Tulasnella sp. 427]|nr:hypothetical protein FRB90_002141 [Tulasnella sp. 427]